MDYVRSAAGIQYPRGRVGVGIDNEWMKRPTSQIAKIQGATPARPFLSYYFLFLSPRLGIYRSPTIGTAAYLGSPNSGNFLAASRPTCYPPLACFACLWQWCWC